MHQALQISEILRWIFRWCDKRSNVTNAIVCTSWQNDGLDLVWEEITSIQHISKFFGDVSVDGYNLQRFNPPLTQERWNRFRERYAWRVQKLTCECLDGNQYPLLDTISRLQYFKPVFPNLKSLVWKARFGGDGYCDRSLIFIHPTLRSFELSVTDQDTTLETLKQYMLGLSERAYALTALQIKAPRRAHDALSEGVVASLKDLPNLVDLFLPAISDPSRLLMTLAVHSHSLKTLILTRDFNDTGVVQITSLPRPVVLRELQRLSIAIPYQMITYFIHSSHESIPRLTNLTVSSTSPYPESPSAVRHLLDVIAEKLPSLQHLQLTFDPKFPPTSSPNLVTMADIVHFAHIEPLVTACKGITHFQVAHAYPLAIDQNELEKIASSWPSLRSLVLSDDPRFSDLQIQGDPGSPKLDLGVLIPLALHCPLLEDLRLRIKPVCSGGVEGDVVPFKSLSRLSPGGLWCEGGEDETLDVAIFLNQICPPSCEVKFESHWLPEKSRIKWNESWNEVRRNRRCIEAIKKRNGNSNCWKQLPNTEAN